MLSCCWKKCVKSFAFSHTWLCGLLLLFIWFRPLFWAKFHTTNMDLKVFYLQFELRLRISIYLTPLFFQSKVKYGNSKTRQSYCTVTLKYFRSNVCTCLYFKFDSFFHAMSFCSFKILAIFELPQWWKM